MKINNVVIKYFKFHQNLKIELETKNCLIYGENGTGKSSIYEALYANFYYKNRIDKSTDIREKFKNRNFPAKNMEVNIALDNKKTFNRKDNKIEDILNITGENIHVKKLSDLLIDPTCYFANEKVLSRLTKENFFIALKNTLVEHFSALKPLINIYQTFENMERLKKQIIEDIEKQENKESKSIEELDKKIRDKFEEKIKSANSKFNMLFYATIPLSDINKIIKDKFDENFKISFDIVAAKSGDSDILEFQFPKIKIKINDIDCKGKPYHHFNEAKLKLIGIAIYFAFAKKYEEKKEGGLKLLVLDDFLTSLDMANRKLIIQYILDEFDEYQKIILTHNLQFDNAIKTLIKRNDKEKSWNFKFLFITNEHKGEVAYLKNKDNDYLQAARKSLDDGEYQISGNFLRKEFESIAEELRQVLTLGKVESLNKIIELIKEYSNNDFYFKPLTLINFIREKISYIQKQILEKDDNLKAQIGIYKSKLTDINNEVLEQSQQEKIAALISIIKKIEFYKDINFNSSSHREKEESYRKEIERGIELLDLLRKNLKEIKKSIQ